MSSPRLCSSTVSMLNSTSRFYNGGILFSALLLVFVALVSLWSFLLLVQTKFVVSGSFGGRSSVIMWNPPPDNRLLRYRGGIIWSIHAYRYPHFYHCFSTGFRFRLHDICGREFEGWSSGYIIPGQGIDVICRLSLWLLRAARRTFLSSISF